MQLVNHELVSTFRKKMFFFLNGVFLGEGEEYWIFLCSFFFYIFHEYLFRIINP